MLLKFQQSTRLHITSVRVESKCFAETVLMWMLDIVFLQTVVAETIVSIRKKGGKQKAKPPCQTLSK